MLPTPSTSHVNYDRIYEPAEDSYLLLDTLSSPAEMNFLHARFSNPTPGPLILEVGTGSGVVLAFVTTHAAKIIGRTDVASLGIDVNGFASIATAETVGISIAEASADRSDTAEFVDSFVGDLTGPIKAASVDVLLFNPPYVPSERVEPPPTSFPEESPSPSVAIERDSRLLYLSTDGGLDGMEVTNRLLAQLPECLSRRGVAYILLCAQNKPDNVMARIRSWPGGNWQVAKVADSGKKAGWEKLCVIRIWRRDSDSS